MATPTKTSVISDRPIGAAAFETEYPTQLKLAKKLPGLGTQRFVFHHDGAEEGKRDRAFWILDAFESVQIRVAT